MYCVKLGGQVSIRDTGSQVSKVRSLLAVTRHMRSRGRGGSSGVEIGFG